jgi:hypothetical protein
MEGYRSSIVAKKELLDTYLCSNVSKIIVGYILGPKRERKHYNVYYPLEHKCFDCGMTNLFEAEVQCAICYKWGDRCCYKKYIPLVDNRYLCQKHKPLWIDVEMDSPNGRIKMKGVHYEPFWDNVKDRITTWANIDALEIKITGFYNYFNGICPYSPPRPIWIKNVNKVSSDSKWKKDWRTSSVL